MTYHFQLQQDLHKDITEDYSAVLNIKMYILMYPGNISLE